MLLILLFGVEIIARKYFKHISKCGNGGGGKVILYENVKKYCMNLYCYFTRNNSYLRRKERERKSSVKGKCHVHLNLMRRNICILFHVHPMMKNTFVVVVVYLNFDILTYKHE